MTVPLNQILKKLSDQISLAKQHQNNPQLFKQYISRAQMLCELMMDEPTGEKVQQNMPMDRPSVSQAPREQRSIDDSVLEEQSIKPEDLAGDSIFDF